MTETTKTADKRICPICGYARGNAWSGEQQCRMSFGGSMEAWESRRADLIKSGCVLLDDRAEQRGFERGLRAAVNVVNSIKLPNGPQPFDQFDLGWEGAAEEAADRILNIKQFTAT